jgi:hypothetical protein
MRLIMLAIIHTLIAQLFFEQDVLSIGRKAGEGGRTLDIHVGNVTLYH